MYQKVGSLLDVLPLLDSDSHIVVDDAREDRQLALEEFCARYAPLVQDSHTQVFSAARYLKNQKKNSILASVESRNYRNILLKKNKREI
jgi:L-fucose mutarotase/ribose pyranase (RbsD/FucU family)